ncbi:MAG: transglutaminase [Bacteroidetes bacterium]|nr:transglutaminase [Bacteroidota bacterium]
MRKIIHLFFLILIPFSGFCYTGEVITSFEIPGSYPTGLTYDGTHLWLADYQTDLLYCIDPATGDVIRSIPAPAYWPEGLAWDGAFLWNADVKGGLPLSENYAGKIYQVDPKDGKILHTIQAPGSTPRGLTWDGNYLWCVDNASDEIIQFSPEDGTTIRSFRSPASDPRGITFDGKYLWISDRIKDEIYMVDPETGSVIIIADAPGAFTRGLAFDGDNLWAVDYQEDKIYKLKVRDGIKYRAYNAHKAKITYTHEVTNFGPGAVKEVSIHLAIPHDRPSQAILVPPVYKPDYTEKVTDKWGQETAKYTFKNLKPGEKVRGEMTTVAKISEVRYFIYPEDVGTLADIPTAISEKYLENNEKYQFDHPVIQQGLKEAVGDETNPYWIFRGIFNYLIDHMYYEMVGGWNTAPTVLERGNGSCSEYSFVYISMCRAAGLPARYVGSVVVRGDYASQDDVFHRWVEVYLPNIGWVPIDPSGGDKDWPRDQANYIGHLSHRYLITTESGGGSKTMGWTYNSNESWVSDPKSFVVSDHFAEWEPVE